MRVQLLPWVLARDKGIPFISGFLFVKAEKMKLIQAPAQYFEKSLFLGGSISGAWNWQEQVIEALAEMNVTIFNPRRDFFDTADRRVEEEQIEWEFRHLRMADAVMFWFSGETLAPITLFELGRHSGYAGRKLFIGIDPEYKRRRDVEIQTRLIRPDVIIHHSLVNVILNIQHWIIFA